MMPLQDPFMTAEINYRQGRIRELYQAPRRVRRPHHWVPRLPTLHLPRPAASLGGRGLSKSVE
jgi:hypothetical protein